MQRFILLVFTALVVSGCRSHYTFLNEPPALPYEEKIEEEEPRIALVLGSGGARGMAHVGVLAEFEEHQIPVDIIVGCSAGSLIGALYADHPDSEELRSYLNGRKSKDFLDYSITNSRYGLVQGKTLRGLLKERMNGEHFGDLQIKLVVVATDLISGEQVVLSGGEVTPAVHASCAVPIYFRPVQLYGRIMVDGGVIDPIPVDVAKKYNPKMIIAVDLTENLPDSLPKNLFGVAKRSLEIVHRIQSRLAIRNADVVIQPTLPYMGMFDEGFEEQLYQSGRQAARDLIPQIKEFMARNQI